MFLWKMTIYLVAGYCILCAFVFLMQRKMLYFPDSTVFPGETIEALGLSHWPSEDAFRGFINTVEPEKHKGCVVVFHGNAGTALHRSYYAEGLGQYGLQVILAEYPGYGGREGKPSETVFVNDAIETIQLAHKQCGEPVYVWGESLGSGVVSAAVQRADVPVAGLVLFLPWDTLPDLAQSHYWYLPARWLVLDKYDNLENLRGFPERIAVVLAGKDRVIPIKHGQRLFQSLDAEKKLWMFDEAGHNTVPMASGMAWWQEIIAFLTGEKVAAATSRENR